MCEFGRGGKNSIPPRWLHCPRRSEPIHKFLAFKTPLCQNFDGEVPEECRFTVDMLLDSLKSYRMKIGLWIDLTNTTRFYNKTDVEKYGIRYEKLSCRGHDETPSPEQTTKFIHMCKNFIAQRPLEMIAVHCTHGFNRTGFMITSFLTEEHDAAVDSSLAQFAVGRPPGIYKSDYIQELYKRYDDVENIPPAPVRPMWCLEYDDANVEDRDEGPSNGYDAQGPPTKRRKKESIQKNPVFMSGIPGVTPLMDPKICTAIQHRVQDICQWEGTGFPGAQPVSMDVNNIKYLHEMPYRVSWKADGTRYMMYINDAGNVYFIDRNNSIFQVQGLSFPYYRDPLRNIKETLLDGEMVIDRAQGKEYPRYLAYDIIRFDNKDVKCRPFYPDRYCIIERELIAGRHRAMKSGQLLKEKEPFSIRLKEFWDVTSAGALLGEKFAKQLSHEPDGLIFQPSNDPYITGQCFHVLKWKPISLNSVDFKLKIVKENRRGMLRKKVGQLWVGGTNVPFTHMEVTNELKQYDNKIIECKVENGKWVFMRERTDKTFPNSTKTAEAVISSIKNPVTAERLLEFIKNHRFVHNDSELMPPPKIIR